MTSSGAVTIAVVVAAVLLDTALASGQEATSRTSQPVFGRADGFEGVHFDPPSMTLTLLGRYARSRSGDQRSSDADLRELLDASTHGYIYDPALVDLSLQGAFGLSQSWYDSSPGEAGSTQGTLYTYDARARILGQKPATLTLYAQQTDQLTNPPYAPTMEQKSNTYGADLDLKSQLVPTTLRLYHTEQTQSSLGGDWGSLYDYSLKQDVFEWRSGAKSDSQTLSWLYQYNRVSSDSGSAGELRYDSQTADLAYALAFGPEHKSSWTLSLDYYDQNGDYAQQRMRGDTTLTLRHSDTFETFAEYLIDRSIYQDSGSTLQKASGGFRHFLWGSLTTTGRVGANVLDDDSGPINREAYGTLSFDYTKDVPSGKVGANLSLLASRRENDARPEPVRVLDEPHTFSDATPVTIVQRNIVPSSIRITDTSHSRLYTEGVDYTMLWFPTYVQILRQAGGTIPPDASVLVDYTLEPQAKSTVDTAVVNGGLRYDFTQGPLRGLGAYVQYLVQDQSVDSDGSAYEPDQIQDLTLGVDYHRGNWVLNGEYERHDSTVSPFESWRGGAQYAHRLGYGTVAVMSVNYVAFDYADSDDRLQILTTAASVEQEFSPHLFGRASVGWFRQDDRIVGSSSGTEGSVGLQWRYGKTQVYTNLRAVHLDSDSRSSDFQLVEIGLTRSF